MAKKSWIVKANRPAKFQTRAVNRCRSAAVAAPISGNLASAESASVSWPLMASSLESPSRAGRRSSLAARTEAHV